MECISDISDLTKSCPVDGNTELWSTGLAVDYLLIISLERFILKVLLKGKKLGKKKQSKTIFISMLKELVVKIKRQSEWQ